MSREPDDHTSSSGSPCTFVYLDVRNNLRACIYVFILCLRVGLCVNPDKAAVVPFTNRGKYSVDMIFLNVAQLNYFGDI